MSTRLNDWLVAGVPGAQRSEDIAARIGVEMTASGVPLDRLVVWVTTLHPTIAGREFVWQPGSEVAIRNLPLTGTAGAAFKASPVAVMMRDRAEVRRRITDATAQEFPILGDLQAQGFTDYVCEPLFFTTGDVHGASFSTRAPGGFSDEHMAEIRGLLHPLARIAEIFALRRVATNLLSTYVGHDTGARILAGRITRGDLESMRAVLWFSDLRGFTAMSSQCTPQAIIQVLNELFDCQVPAIAERGGEVLKFIGDGLLAIFPLGPDEPVRARAADALAAARAAYAALDARNARAAAPIEFGLALHVGDVAYGNIGSASRLDFTAIGPAVNLAARLETLTGKLGCRVVVSSELAGYVDAPLTDLGEFELKGIPGTSRVHGFDPR